MQNIQVLKKKVEGMEAALHWHHQYKLSSGKISILSNAMLKMEQQIKNRKPLKSSQALILAVAQDNELIQKSVSSLPKSALEHGILSLEELKARFVGVERAAREADMISGHSSMFSVLLGSLFSRFLFSEHHNDSSLQDNQSRLSRAGWYLDRGDLVGCTEELEGLDGLCREMCLDWISASRARLASVRAYSLVRAEVLCISRGLNK
jgi:hypothetical protein